MKRNNKINLLFQILPKVIIWIFQVFNLRISGSPQDYLDLVLRLSRIYSSRGPVELVNYCKQARTALLSYLSGKPIISQVRQTKDGLPIVLGNLIEQIRMSPSPAMLQIVLTILFSTRFLNIGKEPNIKTITEGPKCGYPSDIGKYKVLFWKELGYKPSLTEVPRTLRWKQ